MSVAKFLVPVSFAAFMAVGLAYALSDALTLPEVHMSHSTGECVRMVTHEQDGPKKVACPETLPARYELVWAQ